MGDGSLARTPQERPKPALRHTNVDEQLKIAQVKGRIADLEKEAREAAGHESAIQEQLAAASKDAQGKLEEVARLTEREKAPKATIAEKSNQPAGQHTRLTMEFEHIADGTFKGRATRLSKGSPNGLTAIVNRLTEKRSALSRHPRRRRARCRLLLMIDTADANVGGHA